MDHVVLFTLSKNGSLEFKRGIEDAENMARNPSSNLDNLNATHDRLWEQAELLENEVDNQAYTKHQITIMETYIDKLDHVIGLLQDRINEIMNSEEYEARGVRRKSRRKSVRKSRRRKSVKKSRKSRRKSRRIKY